VTGLARDGFRLDLARHLRATATVVADEEDGVARVREVTGGQLADVVVDATSGPRPRRSRSPSTSCERVALSCWPALMRATRYPNAPRRRC
jgi:threonine dehydrogenase-like Zn-dependent dehydrogenase